MSRLTQEMKDMIAAQQVFHATVSKDGIPNNAPKRSTRVLDDQTLAFSEGTGGATYQNILDGSKISAAVVDRDAIDGYRFQGTPELVTEGSIYDQAAEMAAAQGRPAPRAVVLVHIDEIHSLKPGPGAGKPVG
jgi:predicted pyridoxine 5'-phosphate oxidase superfamily flavin-nucleotide-binding protein